ncbi:MAG: hypothetical protein ABWX57_01305 [Aeromicrobium sp.]
MLGRVEGHAHALGGAFVSALRVLTVGGCSGDSRDPVDVLQQVSAPGADVDGLCGEAVAWFTENAGRLPGELDEDDAPVPSPQDQLAACLDASKKAASPDESVSSGFSGHPGSTKGNFQYGMYAEVRTGGESRRLTVVFAATRRS